MTIWALAVVALCGALLWAARARKDPETIRACAATATLTVLGTAAVVLHSFVQGTTAFAVSSRYIAGTLTPLAGGLRLAGALALVLAVSRARTAGKRARD
jgi:hypothetical protein